MRQQIKAKAKKKKKTRFSFDMTCQTFLVLKESVPRRWRKSTWAMSSKQEKDRPPQDKPCLEQVLHPVFYLLYHLRRPSETSGTTRNNNNKHTWIKRDWSLPGLKAQSKLFTGRDLLCVKGLSGRKRFKIAKRALFFNNMQGHMYDSSFTTAAHWLGV